MSAIILRFPPLRRASLELEIALAVARWNWIRCRTLAAFERQPTRPAA